MIGNSLKIINFLYQYIKDDEKIFEIKEYKPKRSKSQNSYAWELIGKLADAMRISKEEMYFQMLKSYGQSELFRTNSNVKIDEYFKYFERESVDANSITYRVFKGSSSFDTREMSIFIDGIIQECTNLEIPTLNEEQIKKMKLV